MLSKKQARLFFLFGTVFFSLVFLGLTVDTIRQVPEQTNSHNISEEVIRGKHLWEENNCMGCHTIMGEGAYYAPELTKVWQRKGKGNDVLANAWLTGFLSNVPHIEGRRRMVQYDFTKQEVQDLIAFLKWVGEIDLNGFPAEPDFKASSNGQLKAVEKN